MTEGTGEPSLVSVVIPAKNSAQTIGAQLDALANQTYSSAWELILADNGSSDVTVQLALDHQGVAERLRVVDASGTPGAAHTRNVGAAAARGDRLLFCDADDVVSAGWIETLVGGLDDEPVVCGPYELYDLNPPWLAEMRGPQRLNEPQMWGPVALFAAGNLGVRRELFEAVGGFDTTFVGHEDHELALRFYDTGHNAHHMPTAVVHYRYRSEARTLFRQGLHYGGSHPALMVAARPYGFAMPPRVEWRPWAWLVIRAGKLRTRQGRLQYLWVLSCRLGRIQGSIRERVLYI